MREIKFRAWDGEQKRMYSWEELLGRTKTVPEAHPLASLYSHGDGSWEIMQFTGLTDKNGKEIYEGDKVKCYWLAELGITEIDCYSEGTVVYMADGVTAGWFVKFDKPFITASFIREMLELIQPEEGMSIWFQVIGNIYHPEG